MSQNDPALARALLQWQSYLRETAVGLRRGVEPFRLSSNAEWRLMGLGDPTAAFMLAHAQVVFELADKVDAVADDLDEPIHYA